jgi:hypothetical protein
MKTKVGAKTIAGLVMYGMRNKLIDWLNSGNTMFDCIHG